MTHVLPYLWYPAFLTSAIAAFGALLSAGFSPALAAYGPIVATGVAIIALEPWFPERIEWRPCLADVKADAAFMAIVQVVLPRVLAIFTVLTISAWMHAHTASSWWPHAWPLGVQIVMMVVAVDFLRYWLHRACHRYDLLWRLHEVHHSPDILYSLNVGRFHPLEKALHFSLDTVPFLLLGVMPEVIAGYFLLYSVNGFFQHSNLRLRYGWLNYVVGSAETHRWHHARDPKTASCNFSNTTIVWDLIFGTWHLPKDHPVDNIGIPNRAYPKGFLAQIVTPFRRRTRTPRRTIKGWVAHWLIELRLRWTRCVQGQRIATIVRNPMRVQAALLARILRENRATNFGRQHDFAAIEDYESFIRRVPVSEYEALRPFVDAEIERGEMALTEAAPSQYVRTSGTTGQPKDIPLTPAHLKALRRIHETAVAFQHRACPEAFGGGILAIVSPACEGMLINGKPFGAASGIVARNTPALVREKFVVPAAVLTINDSHVKYLLILRLALARRDITYAGAANPTTLLALIKLYREHRTALIDDVRRGAFFLADKTPADVLAAVLAHLHADPGRANELAQLQVGAAAPRIADLWPALRLIATWTCASAGVAAEALKRELGSRMRILELGYISSEFRGTITIGRHAGSGLPTMDSHFFEFVEREKWDRGEPEFLTLDRIRKGVDYYLIVTTPSGLYRYFINDLVRVMGFLHKTPLLKFQQKGKGVTNITGEKLYEAQVLAAVRAVLAEMGRAARFVMMLADEEAQRYRLYIEADADPKWSAAQLANAVDERLAALNIEYQAKRESGRLGEIDAHWLAAETGEAYKHHCVQQGQREGQFKTVALAYKKSFGFDLEAHLDRK
jgi:sterol desaturase/sphingolipid hydroxylase (fatty acid hydroxylase superfamily)